MIGQLESSLVRIYTNKRQNEWQIVGAGFLVAERQVFTCAHVVAQALGLTDDVLEAPQVEVHLDLPLVQAGHILTARVSLWQPAMNVAGPELVNGLPADARPAYLIRERSLRPRSRSTIRWQ